MARYLLFGVLGAAKLLKEHQEEINGTIKLVF